MRLFQKIGILVFTLSACVGAVFLDRHLDLRAQTVKPGELYETVYGQVNAVRRDDIRVAYEQAATSVRETFTFVEFSQRIRDDFAGSARIDRIEFGAVQTHGRRAVVQVFFIDHSDRVTPCIYSLVNEGGGWKVSGQRMLKRWDAGQRLDGIRS